MPSFRGFVFVLALFVSSLLYTTTLLFPCLPLLIFPPPLYVRARRLYRQWTGFVGFLFFSMAAYLLEYFCAIKVKLSGDVVPYGEPALIICNHRTRVDWMFLWCLCLHQGQLSGLKIVLKESLKSIPGFGWATQMLLFVFLARNKSKDLRRVREISKYLVGLRVPTTLLIFPEGTDLSPSNHQKSLDFARKEGLQEYQYILHPKVKGFAECLQALRPGLEAVHDVTIAYHDYGDDGPPSETTMFAGFFPKEVHMHVRRHAVNELATTDKGLHEWCRETFREKEARLKSFYEGSRTFSLRETRSGGEGGEYGSTTAVSASSDCRTGRRALTFFVALLVLVLTYGGTIFGLYTLSACCIFTLVTAAGGWDMIELSCSDWALGSTRRSPVGEKNE